MRTEFYTVDFAYDRHKNVIQPIVSANYYNMNYTIDYNEKPSSNSENHVTVSKSNINYYKLKTLEVVTEAPTEDDAYALDINYYHEGDIFEGNEDKDYILYHNGIKFLLLDHLYNIHVTYPVENIEKLTKVGNAFLNHGDLSFFDNDTRNYIRKIFDKKFHLFFRRLNI